ncbi:MAG: hypothetical protein J3Q66DRAFT_352954 [Benniella sp.]|nr:MAG: hypothetical protein J3Q66DRAFT_352954 [Benniella sp.]
MSILMEIPGTILKMTEYKIPVESFAYDLVQLSEGYEDLMDGSLDYRHDGILLTEDLCTETMIMEAKPDDRGADQDLGKLGLVLSNLILGMKNRYSPRIPPRNLRIHGIMFIGYRVKMIEVRLKDDRYPVAYFVSEVTIPRHSGDDSVRQLIQVLKMFIAYKKRVSRNVGHLRGAGNTPSH